MQIDQDKKITVHKDRALPTIENFFSFARGKKFTPRLIIAFTLMGAIDFLATLHTV
jgi:hypothetical protein